MSTLSKIDFLIADQHTQSIQVDQSIKKINDFSERKSKIWQFNSILTYIFGTKNWVTNKSINS